MRRDPLNLGRERFRTIAEDTRPATERRSQAEQFARAYLAAMDATDQREILEHLQLVAVLAKIARSNAVICTSADAVYIAAYQAKAEQVGHALMPIEREKVRRTANRFWEALQLVQGHQEVA